jgi:ribosome-associated protein
MDIRKAKSAVIDALEEIKAKNIVMLNVSKLTSLFDYLVVASGDSNRQTRALANNVKERLKEAGATVYGSEGEETGDWVLVDLGDIVVHVMQPAIRDYYRLEDLWLDGKVEFPKPVMKEKAPARAAREKGDDKVATRSKPKTATKKAAIAKTSTTRTKTGAKSSAKKPVAGVSTAKKPAAGKSTAKKPAGKATARRRKA